MNTIDIKKQAKAAKERIGSEFENRLAKVENFIAKRGIGSSQLTKARKVQRNVNLVVALGCIITVAGAGLTIWALSGSRDDDES